MTLEIIKMAFESLLAKKTRSVLSMLGIIIGVSTVIAVFAIGQGAQKAVDEQFRNLSANSILVMASRGRGATASSKLVPADAKEIMEKAEYVKAATGAITGNLSVSYGAESGNFSINGVDENYFDIGNLKLAAGRLLTAEDIAARANVAVLGSGALASLFPGGEEAVGAFISIAGKRIEVVGVIAEVGSRLGMMSIDDSVFVPSSTAEKSLLGARGQVMINIQARSVDDIEAATAEITGILRTAHGLRSDQEDDFRIMNAGSMVGTAQEAAKMMTMLLTAVAAITLLVSGIGIMNVMFVTVAERTKEIGIAKAIGGKRSDILGQFLLESVILSTIGGLIGIAVGQIAIPLLSRFNIIALAASPTGPLIGFTFSVAVGIFFGFYPAFKASRLDPVDALRSE